jgi:hypothetical protein
MEVGADGIAAKDYATRETDNPAPIIPMMDQERRRSERLKKDTTLTTMEKNQKMAEKRNVEGNTSTSNSFATLQIE